MVMGGIRCMCTGAAQCRPSDLLQTPMFSCSYVLTQQVQTQPQLAQILLPNGQVQQVQMVWGSASSMMSLGSASLGSAATMTQLASSQPITTSTWATSTISTPSVAIPGSHTNTASNASSDNKQQVAQQVSIHL